MCCRHIRACIRASCVQVVEGSLPACQATCKQLLPPLTIAASDSQSVRQQPDRYHKSHQTQQLALSAVLAIVKAAVIAAAAAASAQTTTVPLQVSSGHKQMQAMDGHIEDPLAGTGAAVFHAAMASQRRQGPRRFNPGGDAARVGQGSGGVLDGGLGERSGEDADNHAGSAAVQTQPWQQLAGKTDSQAGMFPDSGGEMDDSEQEEEDGVQLLRLQVLTELVSFPAASSPLSPQVCCAHTTLLHCQRDCCKPGLLVSSVSSAC